MSGQCVVIRGKACGIDLGRERRKHSPQDGKKEALGKSTEATGLA